MLSGLATVVASIASVASGGIAHAAGPDTASLHVRGTTRIESHASRASGQVVLSGTVDDDVGHPEPAERVVVSLSREGAGAVNLSAAAPESCVPTAGSSAAGVGPPAPSLLGADRLAVAVDSQGRFCTRLSLDADRYVAHFESPGSDRIDGAKVDLDFDLRNPALSIVSLAFDPPRSVVSLDDLATDVEVVASIDEDGVVRGVPGLQIALFNETGEALGSSMTTQSGRATFVVPAERMGSLGAGALRASFAGNATVSPGQCALAIERRSRVALSVGRSDGSDAPGASSRLESGDPEEGVPIHVKATPQCARYRCAGAVTGAVEARLGDTVVGAATLEGGEATLVVTFARAGVNEVPIHLRYLPDAPWLLASEEMTVALPVRGPGAVRDLLLALSGLATAAWLVLGRIAPWRARATGRPAKKPGAIPAMARVEVLDASPGGRGWTGVVVDAHEGTIIPGARVAIERRGFERIEVVAESRSGDDGRFDLAPVDPVPGDEIIAEGPVHAPVRDALPACGDLRIAIVLRRRALLDRLVAWARRRGKPFDAKPDPTPAHIRRAAGAESPVGQWADAVEQAAFGGAVVDMRKHAELEKMAPEGAEGPERAEAALHPRPR